MREIKFRGMTEDKNWIYGHYGVKGIDTEFEEHYIITDTLDIYADHTYPFYFTDNKVIKETVGQFTGLHDKNGVEVYENDIVNLVYPYKKKIMKYVGIVSWDNYFSKYVLKSEDGKYTNAIGIESRMSIKVIGNIHERSE